MEIPFDIEDNDKSKTYTSRVDLEIIKSSFKGNSAWAFMYKNHQITAAIKDEDFLHEVHSGKVSIKAGSYITCDLERTVIVDELGLPLDHAEKYTVMKVYGGIKNNYDNQLLL